MTIRIQMGHPMPAICRSDAVVALLLSLALGACTEGEEAEMPESVDEAQAEMSQEMGAFRSFLDETLRETTTELRDERQALEEERARLRTIKARRSGERPVGDELNP